MLGRHEDVMCYTRDYTYASIALLRRGYELFYKAPAANNIGRIKSILGKRKAWNAKNIHAAYMLTDVTLDAFCMVAAFECIAKAILVRKRMAIHVIDSKAGVSLKELAKLQKNEPGRNQNDNQES